MDILFLLLFVAFICYLVANRKELKFLKSPQFIGLGILSLAWWAFLVADQLKTKLSCTPDDELCTSGNTFWGDVTWGTMLAILSLMIVWVPAVFLSIYLQNRKKHHTKK